MAQEVVSFLTAYNVVYELAETLPEPWKSEKRDRINVFSEISEGMKFGLGYFAPQRIVDQLSRQRDKMKQAMFYQEVLGLDNQAKYIYDRDRHHLDKLAVFSLKNERMVRLFLGQEVFWSELKTVYGKLKEYLAGKAGDLVHTLYFYSYGDNGLMIAAKETLTDDGDFVEYIRKAVRFFVS